MDRVRRDLILNVMTFASGASVVVLSALTLEGVSTAAVIGMIAGSFGAGAALVNAVREFRDRRSKGS